MATRRVKEGKPHCAGYFLEHRARVQSDIGAHWENEMSDEIVFEDRIGRFMGFGSLRSLQYANDLEIREHGESRYPRTLSILRRILADWYSIETEHGDCAMLNPDAAHVMFAESVPGSRLNDDRSLVENARRLRAVKSQEWWREKHAFESYR